MELASYIPPKNPLDVLAKQLGTQRYEFEDGDETDEELRERLISRNIRFSSRKGTYYDLVHTVEQAILHNSPVACDMYRIRQTVALEMLNKNKPTRLIDRIRLAFKAFWSVIV